MREEKHMRKLNHLWTVIIFHWAISAFNEPSPPRSSKTSKPRVEQLAISGLLHSCLFLFCFVACGLALAVLEVLGALARACLAVVLARNQQENQFGGVPHARLFDIPRQLGAPRFWAPAMPPRHEESSGAQEWAAASGPAQ